MPDVLFPSSDVLRSLTDLAGQFVAAGVAVGFVGWGLGYVIWFVIDALRF